LIVDPAHLRSLLSSRRSIRAYGPERIPDATLQRLLEAACLAPSAHNRQPWRFVVVRDPGLRRSLADSMAVRFRQDLEADGLAPEEIDARARRRQERLTSAPAAVILCLTQTEMDSYPDPRRSEAERLMGVQSVALAGGHLLLAAHAEGLGACWMCAPLFVPEVVRKVLSLPDDWEPQAMILLGTPAEAPADPGRRPLAEVMAWR
jgi:coenzyme F420-0:L-glutamate ligase/coenzyme F420-1:gamma-L-glutamate ligase